MDKRPEETIQEVMRRGLNVLQDAIHGVTEVLRSGDSAIKELDGGLRGKPMVGESPDETFLGVLALIKGAMEEAREHDSASVPAVVQKAREALNKVTIAEPSWRPGPALVKTTGDMFRVALRDLRGSQALLKVATGQGGLDDLDSLIDWADDVGKRATDAQKVIAEPKPQIAPEKPQKPSPGPRTRPKATKVKSPAKSPVTENQVEQTVFRNIAEASGDEALKERAQKVAQGEIPSDDFANEVTRYLEEGKLKGSMMEKAKKKSIQDGVDAGHPILQF